MTPTLSRLAPFPRLAPLRRVPFWAQALAVCALFAVAGVAVLDDYGMHGDETAHRDMAIANVEYIATGATDLLYHNDYRYYGVAYEMPLLLLERAFGPLDGRRIYLMRHMLTHLFFIAGGFACGMLAYRTLGSRWVALLAMLMFLLHPRLYAHSFFNSKDVPFAAMLLITLYLAHRAFRRDTLGAFLLCGIVVGLAMNLRPFALMLLPMILAMRGLDLWQAGRGERKRILASIGIFAAAALAITYILHPYYWENPLRFIEGMRVLSQHPQIKANLFMGEIYLADAVPWNYIPVWFAITAPPVALALGALGAAAVCWQGASRPLAALRDRETRFRIMTLGCVVLPVAVVIALQSNIYQGWRQMYFLWAPFCLLAAVGLHHIANISMGDIWKVGSRLPGPVRGGGRLHMARRALAYGVVGAGLITTLTAMAALHPNQNVYFNALVDTNTPGALGERYDLDYFRVAYRQSLEYLLDRHPDDTLLVGPGRKSLQILPHSDRERVLISGRLYSTDYLIYPLFGRRNLPEEPAFHSVRAYGSGISFIIDTGSDVYLDYYRAEYDDVEANGTLLARSGFDIYIHNGALRYLKENCETLQTNRYGDINVFLHIFPADRADLSADRRELGFENRDFWISESLASIDGKCIHSQPPLPDYPIARIRTGQRAQGEVAWSADIDLPAHAAATELYDGIAAGDYGQPVARSDFDVYMRGNSLAYLKDPCEQGDADARFFLHIIPDDPADLPAVWREYGIENLDFWFVDHGAYAGDKCVAERELPDYPIARVKTGRNATTPGGDEWRADINLAAHAAAQIAYDGIAAGEYGLPAAQSDFDVYLRGNTLTYFKESCEAGDTDARFLLHIIPADPDDLAADRREFGFDNLDFQFADHGALIGGKCVAALELPDYAIERIRTGQFVGGEGSAWGADIDLAAQALHESIVAGDYGQAIAQSDFDVYLRGNSLAYLKENCDQGDAGARFFLHIIPADPADLPAANRERGFANMDFRFADHGADIGGKCVAERELPDYAIARVRTGQNAAASGGDGWRADIDLAAYAAAQAVHDRILAGDYGQPVAQSDFDVYLRGDTLAYLKESCAAGDADARFFLHIIPADRADLPADRRERGYANMDFRFADHGAYAGDICVATRELPDYAIERIHTGQFVSGEGAAWRVEFAAGR